MAKLSILGIVLGTSTLMISAAQAAEPEPGPSVVIAPTPAAPPPVAPQAGGVVVRQAPGVELPPQVATDVRAAIQDALAGRAVAGVPIEITLEAGGVLIQVGSLWRRVAILRWDYQALRTVALHVLDLLQPAPEVPAPPPRAAAEPASVPAAEAPGTDEAVERASDRAANHATETAAASSDAWNVRASVAGARGIQGPDPWLVSVAAGASWAHDWMRLGLEAGWDHAVVRHPAEGNGQAVNYDALPVRLVLAAQNASAQVGVRAGFAVYRISGEQHFTVVTPLVGPFLALPLPIAGRFHGLLVAGFDYYAHRTELSTGYSTPYSSPQVAPYLAIVVEAGLR